MPNQNVTTECDFLELTLFPFILSDFWAIYSEEWKEDELSVVRVLPNFRNKLAPRVIDLYGVRHKRFILRVSPMQTLFVAHHIDIAVRVPDLKIDGTVKFYGELKFYGEYEWNKEGGVFNWTHHDPGGYRIDGWLTYK